MRVRLLLAFLSLGAVACEIPARGNKLDPANIPDATIEIYANEVGGEPIFEASYTESIFLAAGKSEPSGHDLYARWFVDVPGVAGPAVNGWFDVNDGEEYRISEVPRRAFRLLNALPADVIEKDGAIGVTVIGRIRDADTGGVAEATRFFKVINHPPVLSTPRYVEIPPGGRWWDGGQRIQTTLRPSVSDLDGGENSDVTWEQIGGRPVSFVLAGQNIVVDVPLWEQTVSFRAHATDLAGAETIADVVIAVQDVVWVADGSGLVRRAQEPPIAVTLLPATTDGAVLGAATTAFGETVVWTAERENAGTWRIVRRTPEVDELAASSFVTAIDADTNALTGGAFTNNGGIVWFAAGDTLLAFDDVDAVPPPVVLATNRTLVSAADGITAPHALAPVIGSAAGDAWALFDEASPTVRRLSATTGVSATGTAVAGGIAIEPAFDGGAWVLVSDPANALFPPAVVRLDATGAEIATLELPFPATAQARVFAARSPFHPTEPLRFVLAGGSASANSFLAIVEARDAVTGLPSDGVSGTPTLVVTFRFQEAPVSDVALDPQDGGAWALVPSTGRVRKYFADGTVVRSAGDLSFPAVDVPPMLKTDVRTGAAWVSDQSGALRGIPGAPLVPYPDSSILSSPDGLQLDPVLNRLAIASTGDFSVVVASGSEVERQFFLPDLPGHTGGPVGAAIDPESGCVWFASETRLARQICRDGTGVLPNVTTAAIPHMQALDFDPIDRGLCVAGENALGSLELTVIDPDGVTAPAYRVGISGNRVVDVRSSPVDGACWFLTDTSIGFVDLTGALAEAAATPPGRSLAVGPNGNAYYLDPVGDRIVEATSALSFSNFVDFAPTDTYRNARSVAVDPVRGIVWVAVGPKGADDSPPALLQFNPAGDRIGIVPAGDPVQVIVNR